jgi:hypothetical protein
MHISDEELGHTDPFDGNQMPALVRLIKTPSTIVKTDFTTSDKSSPVSAPVFRLLHLVQDDEWYPIEVPWR